MLDFRSFYKGKRIFVTGHTGFKGAWMTEWLLKMGAQVTGFSIDIPTQPSLFESLQLMERMHSMEGDVCHPEQLEKALATARPEIIFHMAAQSLVRKSYDVPVRTFSTNVLGTLQVLEAARKCSSLQSVVVVTSDKVYDNLETLAAYRETDRLGGKDPYSASKACAEILTRSYALSFFSDTNAPGIATARAGNVIGGGDWALDRIIPDCIRSWQTNQTVSLRAPESVRPWQHVLEPLSGYLLLGAVLTNSRSDFHVESFNFGPHASSCLSVEDVVKTSATHWPGAQWQVERSNTDSSKPEARFLQVNCEKSAAQLGWTPTLSVAEGLEWTVQWYKNTHANPGLTLENTREQIDRYEARMFSK